MDNKTSFSMKMFDLNCINNIKESLRYPYNMEHTLLNSVIWGTSLCIPVIHDAMLIINKRAKDEASWRRLFMSYHSTMLACEYYNIHAQILSDAREYIYKHKHDVPCIKYNFDTERFIYMLLSSGRLYRPTNNKRYIPN